MLNRKKSGPETSTTCLTPFPDIFEHSVQSNQAFDAPKALVAIAYLFERTGVTMYDVMKMMYVADKHHLHLYGRFISGDSYFAPSEGACPSGTYDLVKYLRGDKHSFPNAGDARSVLALDKNTHVFTLKQKPDYDLLSESDIESLDEAINLLKTHGARHVAKLAHDDAWSATSINSMIAIEAIAAQATDGPKIVQHLSDPFPGVAA